MSSEAYRVKRATIDHLSGLVPLWETMQLPVAELEKRLTEFQVAESQDGRVLGAVGFQIAGNHGRIHSEGFADFALADQLRTLLWERIQSVAANHGLVRIWTQEKAPFWSRNGLRQASDKELEKLPDQWKHLPSDWLTIQLREEVVVPLSLDKELALFMESEKQRTERMFRQARALKLIATLLAVLLALFVVGAAVYLFKQTPDFSGR